MPQSTPSNSPSPRSHSTPRMRALHLKWDVGSQWLLLCSMIQLWLLNGGVRTVLTSGYQRNVLRQLTEASLVEGIEIIV
jgi:hypothetical protein